MDDPLNFENNCPGIIVGFDPGLTVGIAILDLDGKLVSVMSFKEASRSDIITQIMNHGKPVLISTDVHPHPKMVKKLSSILKARIDSPNKSLSVESKIETVDNYLKEINPELRSKVISSDKIPQNAHERDALAAALKTYKKYQNKLQQIDKKMEKSDLSDSEIGLVKIKYLQGMPVSRAIQEIYQTKEEFRKEYETEFKITDQKLTPLDNSHENELFKTRQRVKSQQNQIKSLKKKNRDIQLRLENSEREILRLKNKVYTLKKEYYEGFLEKNEIKTKIELIKAINEKYIQERNLRLELEQNLKAVREFHSLEYSKKVPVKIIESFTKEGLREACEYWKIQKGDVVYLKNSRGGGSHTALLISQRGVRAVLFPDQMSHPAREVFEKNLIPLIKVDNRDLKIIDKFAVIKKELLETKIEEWNIQVKNKLAKEDRKKLLNIIDEYRAKRRRTSNS